jgi:type IV secretion system protein VirB1
LLDLLALAAACAPSVAPVTMVAVIRQESGGNPFRIGVNQGPALGHQPGSRDEAVAAAETLLAGGANLDLGLAQVNSANLQWLGLSLPAAFEPCANLRAAATVLTLCYERALRDHPPGQPALQAALSCYNTNSLSQGFANGYVQRVVSGSAAIVPAIDPSYPVPPAPAQSPRRSSGGGIVLRPHGAAAAPPPERAGGAQVLYGSPASR